jgi:hypothetical protein
LFDTLAELDETPIDQLLEARYERILGFGAFNDSD